jgi:hypothetical protein
VERDVVLIVIDPLARYMEGADENSSKDMGAAVAALSRIQHSTGATNLVLHHTGKDTSRGERGHSSLRASADQVIKMKPVGTRIEIRVDKARDAAGGNYVSLFLEPTGSSAALQTMGSPHEPGQLPHEQRQALKALADTQEELTSTEWKKTTGLTDWRFQQARCSLEEAGLITGGGRKGVPYRVTSEGFEALRQAEPSEPTHQTNP